MAAGRNFVKTMLIAFCSVRASARAPSSLCRYSVGLMFLAMGLLISAPLAASDQGRYFVSGYTGRAADDRLLDIVTRFNTGFIDSYLGAVALGWVHKEGKNLRGEIEGQIVRHWGEQDHWEFNAAYVGRWKTFPWDRYVDTSFAVGAGISWATEVPYIEPRAKELGQEESTKLLGYLMMEIELKPPGESPWSGFVRLHHRSGAKGLFDDVNGGSNFIALGGRYYF